MQDVAFDDHTQLHKLVVAVYQIQALPAKKEDPINEDKKINYELLLGRDQGV